VHFLFGLISEHELLDHLGSDGEQSAGALPLAMSMNRHMVAVVDDAAHGIWAGGNKNMPLSAEEWIEIEMDTYQLQAQQHSSRWAAQVQRTEVG
jgi:hypothetical protein